MELWQHEKSVNKVRTIVQFQAYHIGHKCSDDLTFKDNQREEALSGWTVLDSVVISYFEIIYCFCIVNHRFVLTELLIIFTT